MKISLSIAAQDRLFSKAIRRVRPNFDELFDAFCQVEITNPIHEAILIGLTDSELKAELFNIIEQAVQSCPFTNSDKKRFTDLLQEWKPKLI